MLESYRNWSITQGGYDLYWKILYKNTLYVAELTGYKFKNFNEKSEEEEI